MKMEDIGENLFHDGGSEIPVEHLDYSYVKRCSDIDELRRIVRMLQSGKHGLYPHLVEFTQDRIKTINPSERKALEYTEDLPESERQLIENEMQEWLTQVKLDEQDRSQGVERELEYPPVRGIAKMIQSDEVRRREREDIYNGMSQSERRRAASRERLKGNECMKGLQYQEAVHHYTTSIDICRCTLSINNRAQAYIKLRQWGNAVEDCTEVLREEPQNVKAYYRRGRAQQQRGQYQQAVKDFEEVSRLDPENGTAKKALAETLKLLEKQQGKKTGTRIPIVETGLPQGTQVRASSTKSVSDKPAINQHRRGSDTLFIDRNSDNESSSSDEDECSSQSAMEHLKNIRNSRKPALQPRSLLIQELDSEESSIIDA